VELREYGYTEEWKKLRELEDDPRVRGVIGEFRFHPELADPILLYLTNCSVFH
jgi:hypothetical protein